MTTEILIYGGGASGVCAGIQAARLGASVLIVEPTAWVGGKLTAAGVSALDGNKHGAGGGLVHAFREALADHYGGYDALFTGWISLYCYEPRVGHAILQGWVDAEPTLTVWHHADAVAYHRTDRRARTVTVRRADGTTADVRCRLFIDASEYGDGLALAGLPYRLGRESRDELGECAAPDEPDDELQDLTYVATLVRRPGAPPPAVTDADRAHWDLFDCSTTERCPTPDADFLNHGLHDWDSFLGYARLPNNRFMLNWPFHANDFPVTRAFYEDRYLRRIHLAAAKLHTRQFVTYMQMALGHPEWILDTDAYPSADGLPLLPYLRESRRLVRSQILTQGAVVPTEGRPRAPWIADSIAVGDYFLDHHHGKHHAPPGERLVEDYPDNAPFQVPLWVFLPDEDTDPCFLAAEKNIAVSHIVNGCTRLQPVLMLMGQAVGVLAALAVQRDADPADVPVANVQHHLLDAGCQLWPVYDMPCDHPLFAPVQRLALRGILRDDDPLRLAPDKPLDSAHAHRWADRADYPVPAEALSTGAFLQHLDEALR